MFQCSEGSGRLCTCPANFLMAHPNNCLNLSCSKLMFCLDVNIVFARSPSIPDLPSKHPSCPALCTRTLKGSCILVQLNWQIESVGWEFWYPDQFSLLSIGGPTVPNWISSHRDWFLDSRQNGLPNVFTDKYFPSFFGFASHYCPRLFMRLDHNRWKPSRHHRHL